MWKAATVPQVGGVRYYWPKRRTMYGSEARVSKGVHGLSSAESLRVSAESLRVLTVSCPFTPAILPAAEHQAAKSNNVP